MKKGEKYECIEWCGGLFKKYSVYDCLEDGFLIDDEGSAVKVTNNNKNFKLVTPTQNKYQVNCKGVLIDVYDVLTAFEVFNPALQHLLKKAMKSGKRGHKDLETDLRDILASAKRALELEGFEV